MRQYTVLVQQGGPTLGIISSREIFELIFPSTSSLHSCGRLCILLTLSNPALFLSSMWRLQVKLFSDIPECAFYGPLSSLQSPFILTSGYGIQSTSTAHIHAMYVAHSAVNRENTISLLKFYQHLFCLRRWKLDFILCFGFIQPSNAQLHKLHPQHYAHTKGS